MRVRLDELFGFMPRRPTRARSRAPRHADRRQAAAVHPRVTGDVFGPTPKRRASRPRTSRTCSARSTTTTSRCPRPRVAVRLLGRPAARARRGRRTTSTRAAQAGAAPSSTTRASQRSTPTCGPPAVLFDRFLELWDVMERGLPCRWSTRWASGRPRIWVAFMTDLQQPGERRPARPGRPSLYFNRELSWLDFNDRVLQLAEDERLPLLERVKFAAIYSGNLDEFFMVRVAGVQEYVDAGIDARARTAARRPRRSRRSA